MKRLVVFTSAVVAAVFVGRRLMSAEGRERVSRLPGVLITWMMAHMPDE